MPIGLAIAGVAAGLASLPWTGKAAWLAVRHGSVEGSMREVGMAVLEGLRDAGHVQTPRRDLVVDARPTLAKRVSCGLLGATTHEKSLFLGALAEVLDPIGNPRYILERRSTLLRLPRRDYHAVPAALGARKEHAERFLGAWQRHVGPARLIYTRTKPGRKALVRARRAAYAAAFQPRSERLTTWE